MNTIRQAVNQDIPGIHLLLSQVLNVHHQGRPDLFKANARKYTDEELIDIIQDPNKPIFVCVNEQNDILGYAFCIHQQFVDHNIMTDVKTLYIDDLCVKENIRGQHIGSSLYDHVRQYAKQQGYYNVTLNVWAFNENAIKFYQHCGLKPRKICMETILNQES